MTAPLFQLLDRQVHILIAGATGSGKSVLIRGYLNHIITKRPACQFVLIDPKRVDLLPFKINQNVIYYARTETANRILSATALLMMDRYRAIERGSRPDSFAPVYIVIDELADLYLTARKAVEPLQKLAMLGRAAQMHIITATQRPTRELLPMAIKCNYDCRVALRTATAQDSRNITGFPGAEKLPRFGSCLIVCPDHLDPVIYQVPNI